MVSENNNMVFTNEGRQVCANRRGLRKWYTTRLGQRLLESEQNQLDEFLPNLFGYHLLQVGCLADIDMLTSSRISHCMVADEEPAGISKVIGMLNRADAMPIESDSVDVVLLPHTLEFEADPHEVLRESDRILVPEGHVIILGFNPWSIWGIWRWLRFKRGGPPWCGGFRSILRIKDWLALLGFDMVVTRSYFFRPPIHSEGVMTKLNFLETMGKRLWPYFGASFLIIAKKRVTTLTPIKPRWRVRRSMIGADLPKPTT